MPGTPAHLTGFSRLAADVRRLAKLAAKLGAALAIACHLAPPQYRPLCENLATLCGADTGA